MPADHTAVLASGGLDSAVLVADLVREHPVTPVHITMGLAWEAAELAALQQYLDAIASPNLQPLVILELPISSVYGKDHWSVCGDGVPTADQPDTDVFLPGRNVLLIGLAATWCAMNGIHRIAIGSLDANPFPDASPQFFTAFAEALGLGLDHAIEILAPYRGRSKVSLIQQFPDLPLELTLTCMDPREGRACGQCNKCEERRRAFLAAGRTEAPPTSTRSVRPPGGWNR